MSLVLPTAHGYALSSTPGLLEELRTAWPLRPAESGAGYLQRDLATLEPLDVLALPPSAGMPADATPAVAVLASASGAVSALPCLRTGSAWSVAAAGDGVAAALLRAIARAPTEPPAHPSRGFVARRFAEVGLERAAERPIGADQTNLSVVVGHAFVVKWRTSPEADGLRGVVLRRHVEAAGFRDLPRLIGVLAWHGGQGPGVVLADIDAFLPGAEDGYEHAIGALLDDLERGVPDPAPDLAPDLGALTARLHLALATPTGDIPSPRAVAHRDAIAIWSEQARAAIAEAVAIDAPDQSELLSRRPALEADVASVAAIERAVLIPDHGDLHMGQVVYWAGGHAVIDFDGPPGRAAIAVLERRPAARDVAQLLCSLDHVAVAADRRSDGGHQMRFRAWALAARVALLDAYRAELDAAGEQELLDHRLLEPFLAEQLCRELLYAAQVLPRWRYAPMGALRWRYPDAVT